VKPKKVHEFDNRLRQPAYISVYRVEVVIRLNEFLCQLASSVELTFRETPNVAERDPGVRIAIDSAEEQKLHYIEWLHENSHQRRFVARAAALTAWEPGSSIHATEAQNTSVRVWQSHRRTRERAPRLAPMFAFGSNRVIRAEQKALPSFGRNRVIDGDTIRRTE
jgi:hypothetical protein